MRNPFYNRTPFNILIVRMSALGDIVHALPAVIALRRRYPKTRLHWLVDKRYAPLVERVGEINETISFDRREVTKDLGTLQYFWAAMERIWTLVRRLRALRLVGAIVFQPLIRSSLFAFFSGARVRIGFNRLAEGGWFACTRHVSVSRRRHAIEQNLALIAGTGAAQTPDRAPLQLRPEDHAPGDAFFASYQLDPKTSVVLSPASSKPEKQWTPEKWAALADRIAERHGLTPVVVWGEDEEALAREIVGRMTRKGLVAPALSIPPLAAFLAKPAYVVAPDTGPLHLANYLGAPVVGLYGPTNPEVFGPYWPPQRVARHVDPHAGRFSRADMSGLTVDAAFEACDALFREVGRAPAAATAASAQAG